MFDFNSQNNVLGDKSRFDNLKPARPHKKTWQDFLFSFYRLRRKEEGRGKKEDARIKINKNNTTDYFFLKQMGLRPHRLYGVPN